MFTTPDEAETAFYTAFANTDLDAMMAVWLESDSISCVHPVGPRILGREAVRTSWAGIFSNSGSLKFRLADVHRTQDGLLSVHVLHEHITLPGEAEERPPAVTTNIYQLTEKGWRMIMHHASPVAAQLKSVPVGTKLH